MTNVDEGVACVALNDFIAPLALCHAVPTASIPPHQRRRQIDHEQTAALCFEVRVVEVYVYAQTVVIMR